MEAFTTTPNVDSGGAWNGRSRFVRYKTLSRVIVERPISWPAVVPPARNRRRGLPTSGGHIPRRGKAGPADPGLRPPWWPNAPLAPVADDDIDKPSAPGAAVASAVAL